MTESTEPQRDDEWQTIQLSHVLELSVPPGIARTREQAIEGPIGVWEGSGMLIVIDATMYAGQIGVDQGAALTQDTINGVPATFSSMEEPDGTTVISAATAPSETAPTAVVTIRAGPDVPHDVPMRILRSIRR